MPRDPAIDAALFFSKAGKICREAEFIIQSIPNVDMNSVTRIGHLLAGVWQILQGMDQTFATLEKMAEMVECVETLAEKLHEFEISPPPPSNAGVERIRSGRPGQPRYDIDLDMVLFLRGVGAKFKDIAKSLGISTKTLRNHLQRAGIVATRRTLTVINDHQLDEVISGFVAMHPFSGVSIAKGYLDSIGIHIPKRRVNESMRRVDPIGVLIRYVSLPFSLTLLIDPNVFCRWSTAIRRRVYKVRGAQALWHMDGNEKLHRWGFYVHGCVDGHTRYIVYLECRSNKSASTVAKIFVDGVRRMRCPPSRVRGDYGTENNGVEKIMIDFWGEEHKAFIRGR